ncbi:MAG: hypothetical protein OEZ59_04810 [Deltaproteobacteria bacterium]|nr:hypothetical protein [Deltaproteobacteria bacterium]
MILSPRNSGTRLQGDAIPSDGTLISRRQGRFAGRPLLILGALLTTLLYPPSAGVAQAQELTIWRNLYNQELDPSTRQSSSLGPGAGETLEEQALKARGVKRLRVISSDPAMGLVMRFRPAPRDGLPARISPTAPAAAQSDPGPPRLRLILVLIPDAGIVRYQYKHLGEALENGRLVRRSDYSVGEGQETELAGEPGVVNELEVQDDGDTEVRIRITGDVLEVEAIPPEHGGSPDGGRIPYYYGVDMRHADYHIMAGGYRNNGILDLLIAGHIAARLNYLLEPDVKETALARLLATAQLWRTLRFSMWLDGGAAFYLVNDQLLLTQETEISWSAGVSLHFRRGDWGGALRYAVNDEPAVAELLLGRRVWRQLSLFLYGQSFQEMVGYGLGLGVGFH